MDPEENAYWFDYWNRLPRTAVNNALTIWGFEDAITEKKGEPGKWVVRRRQGKESVEVRMGDDGLLRCSQDTGYNQDQPCAHILVTMLYTDMVELPDTSAGVYRKSDRGRKHGVEQRAWKAAPEEVPRLLARLLRSGLPVIEGEDPSGPSVMGRPKVPLHALVYQAVIRTWNRQNLRRLEGVMRSPDHRQHNPHGPASAASLSRFLNDPKTTPILEKLLALSSYPFTPYETIAHQDGTGLTTQHFGAYHQERHNSRSKRREHEWMYSVILWTYEYTAIAALHTQKKGFGEAQWAVPLLMRAGLMFRFQEFGGDAAYAAGYLFDYLKQQGIDAQIKFKGNATGGGVRGPKAPFKASLFRSRVDERGYYRRANRKNNVEVGNAALKRICGDRLYSRKVDGQRNELLCMAIAYNLTRLVYLGLDRDMEIQFDGGLHKLEEWVSLEGLRRRFHREFPHAAKGQPKLGTGARAIG